MAPMFVSDLSKDPFGGKIVFVIYSEPKIGKTELLLDMLRKHEDQRLYLISADKGDTRVRLDHAPYQGRMAVARPTTLREWRQTMVEVQSLVKSSFAKGRKASDMWVCIDTVTSMQLQLLAEARKLDVAVGRSGKRGIQDGDEFSRDLLTQVDYNVNLGHMVEVTNELLSLPANIVMMALEKKGQDGRPACPALSGQSKDKIVGDADIIARLVIGEGGKRVLQCQPGDDFTAGDRTGKLAPVERADLYALRQKIFAPK